MHFVRLLSIIIFAIVGIASAATVEMRTVDDAEVQEISASNAKRPPFDNLKFIC